MSGDSKRRHLPVVDLVQGHAEINARVDERVAELVRAEEMKAGKKSPCARGCAACCRQPVGLELGEAVALISAVRSLPAERRAAIRKRLVEWLAAMLAARIDPRDALEQPEAYFDASMPCPLLVDETCSIYERRPMACRVHVALGDAAWCGAHGRPEQGVDVTEIVHMAVDAGVRLAGKRPAVVNRLPWWLLGGWELVEAEEEPDYDGWMRKILAVAVPVRVLSPMHRESDPGARQADHPSAAPSARRMARTSGDMNECSIRHCGQSTRTNASTIGSSSSARTGVVCCGKGQPQTQR